MIQNLLASISIASLVPEAQSSYKPNSRQLEPFAFSLICLCHKTSGPELQFEYVNDRPRPRDYHCPTKITAQNDVVDGHRLMVNIKYFDEGAGFTRGGNSAFGDDLDGEIFFHGLEDALRDDRQVWHLEIYRG